MVLESKDGPERKRSQPPVTVPYCEIAADVATGAAASSTMMTRQIDSIRFIGGSLRYFGELHPNDERAG